MLTIVKPSKLVHTIPSYWRLHLVLVFSLSGLPWWFAFFFVTISSYQVMQSAYTDINDCDR